MFFTDHRLRGNGHKALRKLEKATVPTKVVGTVCPRRLVADAAPTLAWCAGEGRGHLEASRGCDGLLWQLAPRIASTPFGTPMRAEPFTPDGARHNGVGRKLNVGSSL